MSAPAALFVILVAARAGLRLWLANRQISAMLAGRANVPEPFRQLISSAEHARGIDYAVARVRAVRGAALTSAAVTLALSVGGGTAALDAWLRQSDLLPQPWLGAALLLAVLAILELAELPFRLRRVFVTDARFGLNRISPRLFVADLAKRALLGALIAVPAAAAAILLMEHLGAAWWLAAWLLAAGALLASAWAWPRWGAPLFHRFTPLADTGLERRIDGLLERCGFAAAGVFVADGSKRSAQANAYFTGLGRHKRLVLLDTLIERLGEDQLEAVLAHELGHFRLHHAGQRLAARSAALLIGLALLAWLAARPGFYSALGVPLPTPQAALALFVLAARELVFFATPLLAAWSRRQERDADEFCVRMVGAAHLAAALVEIYRCNVSSLISDPLHSAFYDTHPPPLERLERLRRADPDSANSPLRSGLGSAAAATSSSGAS